MHHGRWPWAIFLIGMPFLMANDSVEDGGIALVLICILLSWVEHLLEHLPYKVNPGLSRKLCVQYAVDVTAGVLAAYATIATNFELDKVEEEHTIALFIAVTLLAASRLYTLSHEHSSTVFRAFAYVVGMGISGVLAVLHLQELVYLTSDTDGPQYSVANTTTMKCIQPKNHSKGFLFDATGYSDTCPTRVWEHVRLNVLFACQLYVLITLTTGLQQDKAGAASTDSYWCGVLAILECIALSIAAAIQFDVIADCNQVGYGVASLVCVSQTLYIIRLFRCLYVHPNPCATRLHVHPDPCATNLKPFVNPGLAARVVWGYRGKPCQVNPYSSSYKLKF